MKIVKGLTVTRQYDEDTYEEVTPLYLAGREIISSEPIKVGANLWRGKVLTSDGQEWETAPKKIVGQMFTCIYDFMQEEWTRTPESVRVR